MNNGQLLLSFYLKRESNRGDTSSPLTCLWLLPSNRIKVIIRKEIKVELKTRNYNAFLWPINDMFHTPQKILRTQFHTSHKRYDKCLGLKLINTKKKPIGLLGVVLITIKKP